MKRIKEKIYSLDVKDINTAGDSICTFLTTEKKKRCVNI